VCAVYGGLCSNVCVRVALVDCLLGARQVWGRGRGRGRLRKIKNQAVEEANLI